MEHQIRIIDGTVRSTGFNITVPEDTQVTLTRIKSSLKKDAVKWYDGLVAKRHEFLVLVKQNWDSINELKEAYT